MEKSHYIRSPNHSCWWHWVVAATSQPADQPTDQPTTASEELPASTCGHRKFRRPGQGPFWESWQFW